jgi:hypothetical protein
MRRVLVFAVALAACSKPVQPATAFQVQSRADLVGGQRALGDIGDFKLSNGLIHAIVQNVGYSRGFGAFGGSLIDLDLVRGLPTNSTQGPKGNDYFTEMFPAFFLLAIEPSKVEVEADGSDGKAAIIKVTGGGGEFISIVKSVNDLLIPKQKLEYTCEYILEPGKSYLKIKTTVTNKDTAPAGFLLTIPFGFVTLLGEGQRLFLPNEAGYDVRFHLDEVYKRKAMLTALPGEVVPMVTTEGPGVSYAVAAAPRGASYMSANPDSYTPYLSSAGTLTDSVLVPIASSSFLGTFWGQPPDTLAPGAQYSYMAYVAVGAGDVAQVQKIIWGIDDNDKTNKLDPPGGRSPYQYATISGRVREAATLIPQVGTAVVLKDEAGRYASEARTIEDGIYTAVVPPGHCYKAYAVDSVRDVGVSPGDCLNVKAGDTQELDIEMSSPATLSVLVTDELGRLLPSKISVQGVYDHTGSGLPQNFFYQLPLGERFRNSDMLDDTADPTTRRYLETVFYAPQGIGGKFLRPGKYTVWASRGPEYSLASQDVVLEANKTAHVELKLTQEAPTPGWVSGDFHVHSINSVDSYFDLPARVTSYAVEGVDLVTSTDHNFVSDFKPTIQSLSLDDWLASQIGLELTTLEMGHYNGYPLLVQPGPITHGSFGWFERPPAELFAQLRGLGTNQSNTVVQVNHPTDTVLGYFSQFNMGTYVSEPIKPASAFVLDTSKRPDGGLSPYDPSNFTLDFDALEVFNGKRDMLLYSFVVPDAGIDPTVGADPKNPFCGDGGVGVDCIPAPGNMEMTAVKLLDGGTAAPQPAFPGALDSWYAILAHGNHITAMGNSDSHSASAEAGLPRTYVKVGASADGSMRGLSLDAVAQNILKGQTVVTNGPFIDVTVNGAPPGGTAVAPTGHIDVALKVQAATWVDVTHVRIKRGGPDAVIPQLLLDIPLDSLCKANETKCSNDVVRLNTTKSFDGIPDKSFIVVEASGDNTMWPVFTPYEISEILISDAVSTIGGSFGYSNAWGRYRPSQTNPVHPFGFTNATWVSYTDAQPLRAPKKVLPVGASQPFSPRSLKDLRKLFHQFHSDPG